MFWLNNKNKIKTAFSVSLPIIFGYLPTGFIFGFMLVSVGYNFLLAPLMSLLIYAGAGQYLAVKLFKENESLLNIAIFIFLINSKHLFYGLSLIEPFKKLGKVKFYGIFALTDETYALLTTPREDISIDDPVFIFFVTLFDHLAWILGTFLGAILGNVLKIDIRGMDFAMTALFIVIVIEQLKSFKTKIPFLIGTVSALFAYKFISKNQVLLFGIIISVFLLAIFKKNVEKDNEKTE